MKQCGATRILFYSIHAVVPVFITGIGIRENECAFFLFLTFMAEKVHFSCCFIQNWEEIEAVKNKKNKNVLEF